MTNKKLTPLLILFAIVIALGVLLAALTVSSSATEEEQGIALCDFTAEEIEKISYSDKNTAATLIKDGQGNWLLESDEAVPLNQSSIQTMAEGYAALTAQRQFTPEEIAELPSRTDTPLMLLEITAGDITRTLSVDSKNTAADIYYVYDEAGNGYSVATDAFYNLLQSPRSLYAEQTLTDFTIDEVEMLAYGDLVFVKNSGNWILADDIDYPIDQSAVKKMINTLCELQTDWTITSPEDDSAYGLDAPDITATLTFTDKTTLTVRFGNSFTTDDNDTLCYVATDSAPNLIYEANADYKNAFAVTKETLYDAAATEETAKEDTIVAEAPVGGKNDYADIK